MQQYEREIMVGALLDITVGQYDTYLDANKAKVEVSDETDPIGKAVYLWHYLQWPADDPDAQHLFVQTIALCSDETLTWIVQNVTGTNPLAVQESRV